jgi:hypothetical protein
MTERLFDNYVMEVKCDGVEEWKGDSSNDYNVMDEPQLERTLDTIFHHDDGNETKSLIWVQCRLCKWSTPVKAHPDGACLCN